MANIFETLTKYRIKVEKDGKTVLDVPSVVALPGMLIAPKISITGLIAAPLLGMKVHVEGEDGKPVDVEKAVKNAAEKVKDTAKSIQEQIDKAWEEASKDEPESDDSGEGSAPVEAQVTESVQEIVEELEKKEKDDVPTIEAKPDDSGKE